MLQSYLQIFIDVSPLTKLNWSKNIVNKNNIFPTIFNYLFNIMHAYQLTFLLLKIKFRHKSTTSFEKWLHCFDAAIASDKTALSNESNPSFS